MSKKPEDLRLQARKLLLEAAALEDAEKWVQVVYLGDAFLRRYTYKSCPGLELGSVVLAGYKAAPATVVAFGMGDDRIKRCSTVQKVAPGQPVWYD